MSDDNCAAPTGDEREARYENVATVCASSGTITARATTKEVSALQLIDAIYDHDEDDINDSVRYGFILEQHERLRIIYQGEPARLVNADTEETFADKMERKHGALAHVRGLLKDAEAERDAALAAIERVRAIHVRDTPSIGGDWCLDDHHKWPCPTVAALDEAPEPEWGWEHRPGHIDHRIDGGAFVQGSVIAPGYVQKYIADGGEVIKRKVTRWLPVGGESK